MTEKSTRLFQHDNSESNGKNILGKFTALAAIGALGLSACGEQKAPASENPSVSAPATSGESTTNTIPEETEKQKYARDFPIRLPSEEARTLEDRTAPNKLAVASDEEIAEMFTISEEELGSYSSPKEYVKKWAEQELVLTQSIHNLGYADNLFQTTSPSTEVDAIAQRYITAAAPSLYPGLVNGSSSSYSNGILHNWQNKELYRADDPTQRITPQIQKEISQLVPNSIEVVDNGNGTITGTYESTYQSQYDFNEIFKEKGMGERQVIDVTREHRVVLPEKPINGVIVPLENKIIGCTDNLTGADCLEQ